MNTDTVIHPDFKTKLEIGNCEEFGKIDKFSIIFGCRIIANYEFRFKFR